VAPPPGSYRIAGQRGWFRDEPAVDVNGQPVPGFSRSVPVEPSTGGDTRLPGRASEAPVTPSPDVAPIDPFRGKTHYSNAPLESTSTRNALRPGVPGSGEATLLNSGDYTGTFEPKPTTP